MSTAERTIATPALAAWLATHPGDTLTEPTPGRECARCATAAATAATTKILHRGFTSVDDWKAPTSTALCPACIWCYSTAQLRSSVLKVTAAPAGLTLLTLPQLLLELGQTVRQDVAIALPSRPGRKHMLPSAAWGRVTLDEQPLTWSSADATRLNTLADLRRLGASATDLLKPVPAWKMVTMTPASARPALLSAWEDLAPWRRSPAWMTVAIIATTAVRA